MEIEVRQILFQILNFGVLFFVLVKFLFRPILNLLDSRSKRIEEGLAAAEKSLRERELLETQKVEELAKAEKKATAIIAAAREESKKMGTELIKEAREEGKKAREKDEAEFKASLASIEKDMQSRLAEYVVAATKKALQDSLSTSAIQEIAAKEIKKLK